LYAHVGLVFKYIDDLAILEITFAPDVVPLITRLEEHFTSYQLKQVAQLTSKYAIRFMNFLLLGEVGKVHKLNYQNLEID
jgi:plasmid replication initiation protein